eukprot:TRINITY_DN5349_c0_g2_i1.p2 TRINITY_DN5349_c0_g2~~TRINITY_DN5349_c0_g2_i1.p2  ORF type:complete len:130 (-),score=20.07 TRINITY_DN5349_c0_g2_i1:1586-1975(-)
MESTEFRIRFKWSNQWHVRCLSTPRDLTIDDLRRCAVDAHELKEGSFVLSYLDDNQYIKLSNSTDLKEALKTAVKNANHQLDVYMWRDAEDYQRAVAGGPPGGAGAGAALSTGGLNSLCRDGQCPDDSI